jgi:hypothetical protein
MAQLKNLSTLEEEYLAHSRVIKTAGGLLAFSPHNSPLKNSKPPEAKIQSVLYSTGT